MTAVVRPEDQVDFKPVDLVPLLQVELGLGPCYDLKPKAIVALANTKLSRDAVEGATVKDEAFACRAATRLLSPSFWSPDTVRSTSSPTELVDRILAKPPTVGGFCSAVACKVINPKSIDTKTVAWNGALSVDNFAILRSQGQFCTTAEECKKFFRLFKSEKSNEKLGDTVFHVQDKSNPAGGQTLMLMKSNKCNARLAALCTPKWVLLAVYHFVDVDNEASTLQLLEDLRREAFESRK
jgi:hypothetical protein